MRKEQEAIHHINVDEEIQIPVFGYVLIRDILLNDILGKDSPQVLYWAGKQLARKFPLSEMNEVISFFNNASWGKLEISKQTKDEMIVSLSGEIIKRRLLLNNQCHFQLEAGFLAEQISMQKKLTTEAAEEAKRRASTITLTIKWDSKDPI
jgi:predicted hydrocarbon binding protein